MTLMRTILVLACLAPLGAQAACPEFLNQEMRTLHS